jgi:hypothetical protein
MGTVAAAIAAAEQIILIAEPFSLITEQMQLRSRRPLFSTEVDVSIYNTQDVFYRAMFTN